MTKHEILIKLEKDRRGPWIVWIQSVQTSLHCRFSYLMQLFNHVWPPKNLFRHTLAWKWGLTSYYSKRPKVPGFVPFFLESL